MNQAPFSLPGTAWGHCRTWSSSPLIDRLLPATQPPSRHATCCGTYPPPVTSAFSEEMHLMWMPVTLTVVAVDTVCQPASACWIRARETVDRALMITLSGSANGG